MSWLTNTKGQPSASLTLMVISFIVVMVKALLGGSSLVLAGWTLNVSPIDPDLAAVLLGVPAATYGYRRSTDAQYDNDSTQANHEG